MAILNRGKYLVYIVLMLGTLCMAQCRQPQRSTTIPWLNKTITQVTVPDYSGTTYTARVPDTLDLAERAGLAVNGLTGPVDPDADYEIYWILRICGNKPCLERDINDQVQVQWQEALPLMRLLSGCKKKMYVEQRWLELLFQQQGPDGSLYLPVNGRPWFNPKNVGEQSTGQFDDFKGDQFTGPMNSGCSLGWVADYYILTGDERYKQAGEKLVDGFVKMAVHRDDYAFCAKGLYGLGETIDQNAPIPSFKKNAVLGWDVRYLVKFYQATGYEPALQLAGEFTRYLMKYGGLITLEGEWVGANRHAGWNAGMLLGVLKYAIHTGDEELLEWCRMSFERQKRESCGELLTGFFPEYSHPTGQGGETCAVAFMIQLAVTLSEAGVADYWDDVDRWTRNHLAVSQITDADWMKTKFAHQKPKEIDPVYNSYDQAGEKNVGNFVSWPLINDSFWFYDDPKQQICMHCCAAEGSLTLFRVWKSIVNYHDGNLKVNLLMNQASPWADINSYIPYEGRVDIKLKTATQLAVRIPEWVKIGQTQCTVNGENRSLSWDNRYAIVGRVNSDDVVTMTFPIFERTNIVNVQGKEYTLTRKGNEVIHIEPEGKICPSYQRDKYRKNKAKFKTVKRFIPDKDRLERIMKLYY